MEQAVNDINACIETLKQYEEKAQRLAIEYEEKVRKSNYSFPIENLINKIPFSEISRLDLLCVSLLGKHLGKDSSSVKDWYINKDVGVSSPEDLVIELRQKLVILEYARNLLSGHPAAMPRPMATSEQIRQSKGFRIPEGYEKLQNSCTNFMADKDKNCTHYEKNVFVMTRFEEGNARLKQIDRTIRQTLQKFGLYGHRADDKCYTSDRNLWDNVCTYMVCCKYGITILEDIDAHEFNPNVALEYGFMRALNKPTLLLKEKRFVPRADIMGTLWEPFDIFQIEATISKAIERWLKGLGLEK
jgi:hypothetical protein